MTPPIMRTHLLIVKFREDLREEIRHSPQLVDHRIETERGSMDLRDLLFNLKLQLEETFARHDGYCTGSSLQSARKEGGGGPVRGSNSASLVLPNRWTRRSICGPLRSCLARAMIELRIRAKCCGEQEMTDKEMSGFGKLMCGLRPRPASHLTRSLRGYPP